MFLILFVCLRKSPARRCTFCSNERLYKPCELRAVSWSRQPALEVIAVAKLSIQLKQMSCSCYCCYCCLVAKWAWLRFWPKNASNSRQLAAKTPKLQVAPVLTQTTWKKKRKIKKSKTKTKLKCNRNQPPKTFAAIRRPSQVMQQPANATAAGAGTVAILKSLVSNPRFPPHICMCIVFGILWLPCIWLYASLGRQLALPTAFHIASCVCFLRCFIFYGATEVIDLTKCH